MTRLTVRDKDSIIRQIVADLPNNPFSEKIEQALNDAANEKLPTDIRKIDQNYINHVRFWFNGFVTSVPAPVYMNNSGSASWKQYFGEKKWSEIEELCNARHKWNSDREVLKEQIKANVYSCSTEKQFTERFPDLVKYLPERRQSVANLPATNDFMERLKSEGLKL